MRIFLSYSSHDRQRAEDISLALEAQGHAVFFDRSDLAGGEDYGSVIRDQIAGADLFIFLITPASVTQGAYTLSELRMARDRWSHPGSHVLPVLLEPTTMNDIPAYLRSVTLFQPEGNAAAEIAALVSRLASRRRRRLKPAVLALAGVAVLVAVLAGVRLLGDRGDRDGADAWKVKPDAFVTRYVYGPEAIRRTEYALDPTFPVRADWSGVVRVSRMAFGTIAGTGPAMSVDVVFTNAAGEPIQLDLTPRFFELEDDQGRKSELLYFCCRARGEILGPGQERQIQLIFAANPGWSGKATNARAIEFHVNGLLPLARGRWVVPALATAN